MSAKREGSFCASPCCFDPQEGFAKSGFNRVAHERSATLPDLWAPGQEREQEQQPDCLNLCDYSRHLRCRPALLSDRPEGPAPNPQGSSGSQRRSSRITDGVPRVARSAILPNSTSSASRTNDREMPLPMAVPAARGTHRATQGARSPCIVRSKSRRHSTGKAAAQPDHNHSPCIEPKAQRTGETSLRGLFRPSSIVPRFSRSVPPPFQPFHRPFHLNH